MTIIEEMMEQVDSILTEKGLREGRSEMATIIRNLREAFPNSQKEIDGKLEELRINHGLNSWIEDIDSDFSELLRKINDD